MRSRIKIMVILLALWQSLGISAQGQEVEDNTAQELEPITVSGKKEVPCNAPVTSRYYLPESVQATQTLTREDIEAIAPHDVSDLIETSLGMSIRRQGARVHNFSFSRGDSVSVILNGVYLTSTEARRMIGDIPVEMIDSIKFVRDASVITVGPLMSFGSVSKGSPNQGFIIIETRKKGPDTPYGTELVTSFASYDTWKASGFTGHSWQDDRFTFSGGYQRTQSQGREHWNNGYEGDTFLLNGGFNSDELQVSTSFYYNSASREIQRHVGIYTGETDYPESGPTPAGVLNNNIWKYDPIETLLVTFNLTRPWNEHQTTSLTYGWNRTESTRYGYTTTTDKDTVISDEGEDRSEEWNLSHAIAGEKNTLKFGAQVVTWYQRSEMSSNPDEERIYGVYATDAYKITPDWSVDAAIRMDKKKIIQGGDKYLSSGTTVKLSDGEWTDEAYVLSLGNAWQVNSVWKLTARYSFNLTPTPDVLTTLDDKELPDEERHRYEVGIEAFFNDAFRITATPFYYNIKNSKVSAGSISTDANRDPIIDPDTGEETTLTIYDADNRELYGFEMSVNGNFLHGMLGYELGWTHFVDSDEDGETGNEFPENKYSGRLNWHYGDWDSNVTVLYVAPYLSNGYTVGDFTVINMSISWRYSENLKLTLFGQNLLDDEYTTNNKGYPTRAQWGVLQDVGATVGVALNYRF
ncbi:TonB-dependent receptor domain-containing protein [uncultured Desulfobacter sp.]|uniref:TonB-dependent receptor plug domain-containing protein n=1 Tax=uncultured Desulfobacter sp. TaxID=240139 RepID=UPI0029F5C21E|nr:TonB-dependent receptor [uncultured Desulfobacter sp.]